MIWLTLIVTVLAIGTVLLVLSALDGYLPSRCKFKQCDDALAEIERQRARENRR